MNKKILLTTTLIVVMLLLLPITAAVPKKNSLPQTTQLLSIQDLQRIPLTELFEYLLHLTDHNPELYTDLEHEIKLTENNELLNKDLEDLTDNNESLIHKIWNQIFNYRLLRLYISFGLLIYTQSNFLLLRTLHWAIKTLQWLQVGIILGIIDMPDSTPPETPTITFTMDTENNTLTVIDISSENILWSDIDQIGSGTTDPLPTGNITIGDMITNCTGIIVLRYKPTGDIIGVYEFE